MTITTRRLVVTPSPQSDESLPGYLLRLTECNGLRAPSWLCHRLSGGELRQKVLLNFREADLTRLTGWPSDSFSSFGLAKDSTDSDRNDRVVRGVNGNRSTRNLARPMFCPLCAEECGYISTIWDAEPVVVCPVHLIHGVSMCFTCGAAVRWERPQLLACNCGSPLSNSIPVGPVDDLDVVLAELVAAAASGLRPAISERLGLPVAVLMQQPPAIVLRFLDMLVRLSAGLSGQDVYGPSPRTSLRPAVQMLKDWPRGLAGYLQPFMAADQRDVFYRHWFHHCHGVFNKPNREKPELSDCLSMLADALFDVINVGEPRPIDKRIRDHIFGGRCFRWTTASTFADSLGIGRRRLKQLVHEGQIDMSQAATRAAARTLVVQTRDDVLLSLKRLDIRKAAKKLGLPFPLFFRIVGEKIFPDVPAFDGRGITRRSVQCIEQGLRNLAKRQPRVANEAFCGDSLAQWMSMKDLMRSGRFTLDAKLGVLRRMENGELFAQRRAECFGDLLVDVRAFGHHALSHHVTTAGDQAAVYVMHAAELLECSDMTIHSLVGLGHLKCGTSPTDNNRISLSSLRKFKSRYISLRELGSFIGLSTKKARKAFLIQYPRAKIIQTQRKRTPFVLRSAVSDPFSLWDVLDN